MTRELEAAAALVAAFKEQAPGAYTLATAVSPAMKVEPALLRRARLELRPELGAGTESDVWWSPLVGSRSTRAIVFSPEVLTVLRRSLIDEHGDDEVFLERHREVVEAVHRGEAESVLLEEEVIWLSMRGGDEADAAIEQALRRAVKGMVENDARGLEVARWADRAMTYFPASVREGDAAKLLTVGAALRLGSAARVTREAEPPSVGVGVAWLKPERPAGDAVTYWVSAYDNALVFNTQPTGPAGDLVLAAGDEVVLDLFDTSEEPLGSVAPGPGVIKELPEGVEELIVRTASGEEFRLSFGAASEAAPLTIYLSSAAESMEMAGAVEEAIEERGHRLVLGASALGEPGLSPEDDAGVLRRLEESDLLIVLYDYNWRRDENGRRELEAFLAAKRAQNRAPAVLTANMVSGTPVDDLPRGLRRHRVLMLPEDPAPEIAEAVAEIAARVGGGLPPLPQQIFLAYTTRPDRPALEQVKQALAPLEEKGLVTLWEDSMGSRVDEMISSLGMSNLVVLLASEAYFESQDYRLLASEIRNARKSGVPVGWIPIAASNILEGELGDAPPLWDPTLPLGELEPSQLEAAFGAIRDRVEKWARTGELESVVWAAEGREDETTEEGDAPVDPDEDSARRIARARELVAEKRKRAGGEPSLQHRVELAESIARLAEQLSGVEPEEALEAAEEAASMYRGLVEGERELLADFAGSLLNLGLRLADVGRHGDAVNAAEEAVEALRGRGFAREQARALNHLAAWLASVGRLEGALQADEEAAEIYRGLWTEDPGQYSHLLVNSLTNTGVWLSKLGRFEQALSQTEQAVEIARRAAAEGSPDTLAIALTELGRRQAEIGQDEAALAALEEAVEIRRSLLHPATEHSRSELAESLDLLARFRNRLGLVREALEATEEAVAILQELAQDPGNHPYRLRLARALEARGDAFAGAGDHRGALAANQQAVEIYRTLEREHPSEFLPDLADSLETLGERFEAIGDAEESLALSEEASEIQHRLDAEAARGTPAEGGLATPREDDSRVAAATESGQTESSAESEAPPPPLAEEPPSSEVSRVTEPLASALEVIQALAMAFHLGQLEQTKKLDALPKLYGLEDEREVNDFLHVRRLCEWVFSGPTTDYLGGDDLISRDPADMHRRLDEAIETSDRSGDLRWQLEQVLNRVRGFAKPDSGHESLVQEVVDLYRSGEKLADHEELRNRFEVAALPLMTPFHQLFYEFPTTLQSTSDFPGYLERFFELWQGFIATAASSRLNDGIRLGHRVSRQAADTVVSSFPPLEADDLPYEGLEDDESRVVLQPISFDAYTKIVTTLGRAVLESMEDEPLFYEA